MVNSLWCNFHDLGSISSRSNDVKWYEFCNSNVDLPILLIISTVIARNKTKIRIGRQLKQKLYFSIFWNFQIKILKIRDNQRRRHDIVHWCLFLNAFWIKRQHSEAYLLVLLRAAASSAGGGREGDPKQPLLLPVGAPWSPREGDRGQLAHGVGSTTPGGGLGRPAPQKAPLAHPLLLQRPVVAAPQLSISYYAYPAFQASEAEPLQLGGQLGRLAGLRRALGSKPTRLVEGRFRSPVCVWSRCRWCKIRVGASDETQTAEDGLQLSPHAGRRRLHPPR